MKKRAATFALSCAILAACSDGPVAPHTATPSDIVRPTLAKSPTGLVLNSLTNVALPLIPIPLGDIRIDQAVITNLALVENAAGLIVGLQAEGIIDLTGGVLGTDVLTQNFATTVSVTSTGPGQCDLVTIDLSGIRIDALGLADVDVPAATLTGRGSGAVGSLLCNLGNLLGGLGGGGGAIPGAGGIVNALNNRI